MCWYVSNNNKQNPDVVSNTKTVRIPVCTISTRQCDAVYSTDFQMHFFHGTNFEPWPNFQTSRTSCICACTHTYTHMRMHIVCPVVFAWKKACLVAVFVVFLPKMRNNRMTGRFSSINPACCIVACVQIRARLVCMCVCVCVCMQQKLAWYEILAPHCRILYRKSLSRRLYGERIRTYVRGWNTRALDVGGQ